MAYSIAHLFAAVACIVVPTDAPGCQFLASHSAIMGRAEHL